MSQAPLQCARCAAVLGPEDTFCEQCGNPVQVVAFQQEGPAVLRWEADIKLGNPLFLRQLAILFGVTALVMALLLTFLLAVTGEPEAIPQALLVTAIVTLGLGGGLLLVTLIAFRGRMRVRFTLDRHGISSQTLSTPAKGLSRLAALLGLLARNPTLAGAGAAGVSREVERVTWEQVARIDAYPAHYTLALRNRWRLVMLVVCTAETYALVADRMAQYLRQADNTGTTRSGNPLPALLFRSVLVVAAATPLFILPYPLELDILLPLIILLFALATVWLVPLFGYVVIGASLLQAIVLIATLLTPRQSMFRSVGTYRTIEILATGDWVMLGLAVAGLGYLCWLSWRAVRGKLLSGLMEP